MDSPSLPTACSASNRTLADTSSSGRAFPKVPYAPLVENQLPRYWSPWPASSAR
jgi:hypothetical protein